MNARPAEVVELALHDVFAQERSNQSEYREPRAPARARRDSPGGCDVKRRERKPSDRGRLQGRLHPIGTDCTRSDYADDERARQFFQRALTRASEIATGPSCAELDIQMASAYVGWQGTDVERSSQSLQRAENAVEQLSRSAARHDIRVTAVCPDPANTHSKRLQSSRLHTIQAGRLQSPKSLYGLAWCRLRDSATCSRTARHAHPRDRRATPLAVMHCGFRMPGAIWPNIGHFPFLKGRLMLW